MTSRELTIIYDRLRHTLDLIPLSSLEGNPELLRVRQDILKILEALALMIATAKKEVATNGRKKGEK